MSQSPLIREKPMGAGAPDLESEIRERYSRGAQEVEPGLCCATIDYDPKFLQLLPREIIEKDYGCGDPSRFVREGETVVDLGSGTGKVCYILSQRSEERRVGKECRSRWSPDH